MYKFFIILFCLLSFPTFASNTNDTSLQTEVKLSPPEIIKLTRSFFESGKIDEAKLLLQNITFDEKEFEIERLFLLGQIAKYEDDFDTAIKYFRSILNDYPNLARVRMELATTYMLNQSWLKADYNLRLASSEDIPEVVNENIRRMLFIIRQNKNYNFWFNMGIAPDNNINNAQAGSQCISTIFGILCNELPEPEKSVGFNLSFGGDYEARLSDNFRLRNDFAVFGSLYDKKKYDDLYVSFSTGPKYVYSKGDIWTALTMSKRWLGHKSYNDTLGFKLQTSYDFSRRFSMLCGFNYIPTHYDEYKMLDGEIINSNIILSYILNSSSYLRFKIGIENENTQDEIYTNTKSNYAIGIGGELPYGFNIYVEPSIQYINYDNERSFVKDFTFTNIKEKSIIRKYSISLANKKIDIYGFSPTITYSYTDKNSNVWQNEYTKSAIEFTMTQRF